MATLVLKSWRVQNEPEGPDNTYVLVTARRGGIIAWLLTLAGVDATTVIRVTSEKIQFSSSSLSGTNHGIIPLENVCSTYYGYQKPWKPALFLFLVFVWLGSSMFAVPEIGGLRGLIFIGAGFLVSALVYFLNRSLTLGFVEHSGVLNGIQFKRSVIENVDINESQAEVVTQLIEALIEMKQRRYVTAGS